TRTCKARPLGASVLSAWTPGRSKVSAMLLTCKGARELCGNRIRGSPQAEQRQGIRSGWGRARSVTEAVGPMARRGQAALAREGPRPGAFAWRRRAVRTRWV